MDRTPLTNLRQITQSQPQPPPAPNPLVILFQRVQALETSFAALYADMQLLHQGLQHMLTALQQGNQQPPAAPEGEPDDGS